MSVDKFCKTLDIKDLLQLSPEIKNLFLEVSLILCNKYNNIITTFSYNPPKTIYNIIKKIIIQSPTKKLYGFYGMAYIIKNMLKPSPPTKWNYIYGVYKIDTIICPKYGLKVLLLDDTHTLEHICPGTKNVSANKFIVDQIKSAQCFIDLYLEIPYIFVKDDIRKRFANTYIAKLHDDLDECFEWDKIRCRYPHLRAHYVDLRGTDLDIEYISFSREFVNLHFNISMEKSVEYWKNNMYIKNIFKSKTSIINNIHKLIKNSKIQKQIDNISDPYIVKKINDISKKWIENPIDRNINWAYMTWEYLISALETKNQERINNIYYSLASYNGVLMDIYTLGRMFRNYKYIPNQNSSKAKDIIIYAGGQHINRYRDFLLSLGGKIDTQSFYPYSIKNCVDISHIKQPIFSTEHAVETNKNCPPCSSKHICNTNTGRCVVKTGVIGKKLLKNSLLEKK